MTNLDLANNQAPPLKVLPYEPKCRAAWDDFVAASKNGVFLFNRGYMDYHSYRFTDHSLMFYQEDELVALLPANLDGEVLRSHGGLTFGGVLSVKSMKTPLMLKVFLCLLSHCREADITGVIYKPVPYIYHSVPADEDLYALFSVNAVLSARNVSSAIYLPALKGFDDNRQDNIRKAKRAEIEVRETSDYDAFMKIESESLIARHGVLPVHSADEMKLLARRFPDCIKLYGSYKDDVMLAGVIIYESQCVAHMQYAANSPAGRSLGAQDIIEDYLINERYRSKRYFDFGISTEKMGQVLNLGLIKRKENFGASAVIYDTYQITV
ncbi:MAG: GNAT family N-acetyltransferase [Candidatus Bathyarchaeota archaeon]|nr:GNAT family N-acetyltransferase [Candidatus Bathyarchaeota archaeon]